MLAWGPEVSLCQGHMVVASGQNLTRLNPYPIASVLHSSMVVIECLLCRESGFCGWTNEFGGDKKHFNMIFIAG